MNGELQRSLINTNNLYSLSTWATRERKVHKPLFHPATLRRSSQNTKHNHHHNIHKLHFAGSLTKCCRPMNSRT